MGFDLVEIALDDPNQIDASKLSNKLEELDLEVTMCGAFGPERDVSHEKEEVQEAGVDYIKTALNMCDEIGSPVFAGPAYSAVGKSRHLSQSAREAERERAVENLQRCAEYAKKVGVDLAIEPLNRFETDMVNTVEQGLDLIEKVKSPNLKLHLDTFHMNIEEKDMEEAIIKAGGSIAHFHASENDRGSPGSGHVPWGKVAEALKDTGYDRAVVIESFIPEVEEIARAASIWRPLASSSDQLAKDGLNFLQEYFGN
ncbi:sugar phosphate isomerase/epimerase [Candidatus Bipolaricaulota bacterium]|nr:sugar phosphate isomerase/epimerase [Candidatus Bipolaricaulota bacterium]